MATATKARNITSIRRAFRFGALAFLCVCAHPQTADRFWKEKSIRSHEILRNQGAEASLAYLANLPAHFPEGDYETPREEYLRFMAIADLEYTLGRWSDADRDLRHCLTLSSVAANPKVVAKVELTRFNNLSKLNNLEEAAKSLRVAREYATSKRDASLDSFILHDTGLLLEMTGRFEEAVHPLNRSLELFEEQGDNASAANLRISLAWVYYHLGQFDRASEEYLKAQKQADPRDQHLVLGHLGNLAYQTHEFARAARYYNQAAANAKLSDRDYHARWLANEATNWIELGQWKKAEESNEAALTVGDGLPVMSERQLAIVNRARIAAGRGLFPLALCQLQTLVKSTKEPGPTLDAYKEMARIYRQLGDASSAQSAYSAGLSVVDRQRTELHDLENKLSFEAKAIDFNQEYVNGLMAHAQAAKAFEVAEASRARMLRDTLALPDSTLGSVRLAEYVARAKRTGLAYLSYWIAPECSYLWVIAPGGFAAYTLPGEIELRDRVNRFQQAVQERQDSAAPGAALFNTLVQPASELLQGVRHIVIVPDGPLYGMNFETLRQGSPEARYWIQDTTISIAPSLSLMISPGRAVPSGSRILLMGDAIPWSTEFPKLLNAARELNRTAELFPPSDRTALTQARATAQSYEVECRLPYRYIHFATHAAANRIAPLESAIILSQEGARGELTARDVLRCPLDAEVVSISACQSAGSRTYAGEGLVGLAWAFLRAGAHSVVAGLWNVNDYSSPLIMSGLYERLTRGEQPPEALRSAKLKLLEPGSKYTEPYYWGAVLLYRGAGTALN